MRCLPNWLLIYPELALVIVWLSPAGRSAAKQSRPAPHCNVSLVTEFLTPRMLLYVVYRVGCEGRRTPPPAPPVRSPDQDQRYAKDASGFAPIASTRSEKIGSFPNKNVDLIRSREIRQVSLSYCTFQSTYLKFFSIVRLLAAVHRKQVRQRGRRRLSRQIYSAIGRDVSLDFTHGLSNFRGSSGFAHCTKNQHALLTPQRASAAHAGQHRLDRFRPDA
jgi:hypothetical protein